MDTVRYVDLAQLSMRIQSSKRSVLNKRQDGG
jgi:hypothetical protein